MTPEAARRTAATVGLATSVIGGTLVWAPDTVVRALRLSHPQPIPLIGLADLVLVPGLIAGRPRWPWMAARAGLNVVIAAYLIDETRRSSEPRLGSAALLMAAITVADCVTTRRLRADERRPRRGRAQRVRTCAL